MDSDGDTIKIRKYKQSDFEQVIRIFSEGVLEHRRSTFLNGLKGVEPKTLCCHIAAVAFGVCTALFWSFMAGVAIVISYGLFHVCLINFIFYAYLSEHLQTDMKDRELSFWTTEPNCFLVASDVKTDQILGIVSMQKKSDEVMELNRLSVQSQIRGLGIGRKLVDGIIEEARNSGYKQVYLETTNIQQTAIKLYKKIGFEKVGEGSMEYLVGPYIPSFTHGMYVVKYRYNIINSEKYLYEFCCLYHVFHGFG